MRRMIVLVVALLLAVGGFTSSSVAASTKPVPFPSNPDGLKGPVALPDELDPTPGYVPQIACQPGTPAGVAKLRALVLDTYGVGGAGNTSRKCNEGTSEHADGRAWDWMVNVNDKQEKAAAGDFLAWLTANRGENAKRLGIMYVIHNKMIWAVYRERDGWRPSYGHTDHIHISFSWNGAKGTTSFWKGQVQRVDYGPCREFVGQPAVIRSARRGIPCASVPNLVKRHAYSVRLYGMSSSTIKTAQGALGRSRTGSFDSGTWDAVKSFQRAHDLPVTGALDVPTWAALVPTRVTKDVSAGFSGREARRYGLARYAHKTLRYGDSGKSILMLQRSMAMKRVDRNGYFGTLTKAAVIKRQKQYGLKQTGLANGELWQAMVDS